MSGSCFKGEAPRILPKDPEQAKQRRQALRGAAAHRALLRQAQNDDLPPAPPTLPYVGSPNAPRRGVPRLRKEERTARNQLMLMERLTGASSISELAQKYRLNPTTVQDILTQTRKSEVFQQAQTAIIQDLLPKALAVYSQALDNGDVDVASKVIEGLGILSRENRLVVTPGRPSESFEEWRMSLTKTVHQPLAIALSSEQQEHHDVLVIDAVPTDDPRVPPASQPAGDFGQSPLPSPEPQGPPRDGPAPGQAGLAGA